MRLVSAPPTKSWHARASSNEVKDALMVIVEKRAMNPE
jgi:hypothetical protein